MTFSTSLYGRSCQVTDPYLLVQRAHHVSIFVQELHLQEMKIDTEPFGLRMPAIRNSQQVKPHQPSIFLVFFFTLMRLEGCFLAFDPFSCSCRNKEWPGGDVITSDQFQ